MTGRIARDPAKVTTIPATPPGEDPGPAPASPPQRRLWFLDRLEPGSTAYHVPMALHLLGDLDVEALERALAEVVARHAALRTRFGVVDAEPVQVVDPVAPMPLPVHVAGDEAPLEDVLAAAVRSPFDLSTGPLLRADLVRRGSREHVLVLTAHHAVVDGWSLRLLFEELTALYAAGAGGPAARLPDLPVQYGDHARWQIARRDRGLLREHADWWRRELAGAPDVLTLPTTRPRSHRPSADGAVAVLRLGEDLTDEVSELALATGSTLYMTLLAGFQLVLGRLARSQDVVVGSPIAGRALPELEPVIGCFVNTLPIRTDLSGDPSFRELVHRVRTGTLRAFEHQELSFEALVEEVRPDRRSSSTPIFQVLFSSDETDLPSVRTGDLQWRYQPVRRTHVKYDLNVTIARDGADLQAVLEYRTDLFDAAWAAAFLRRYRRLLAAAVAAPDAPAATLPLLDRTERSAILLGRNDTDRDYDLDTPVTELLARQAAATPAAEAVVCGDERISYAELHRRSGELALRLRALGAGPGPGGTVGLCLHRSVDLVVAVHAVLRAGAAYLPLESSLPRERLAFLLADAGARLVVTHGPAHRALPDSDATVLDLDLPAGDVPTGDARDLPVPGPDDIAYVIYTSGSTGRPKGVPNRHRGLVNRLLWMQERFPLDARDAVVQKTPFGFDVSVWEFLWPLFTGARLVVARPDGHRDPAYLAGLIRAERVTIVHFVPSMLQAFTEAVDLAGCPSLRRIVCSGEALPPDLVRRVHARSTTVELHNLYGPTEAAIDVSHWFCDPAADAAAAVPIGFPVPNTRLYVLDPHGEPVPDGVTGELVIGGVQVADGYVNRPELTADRFVPDRFVPDRFAGADRLYRTGDLASYRHDGALEFLGRLDDQVKLRGLRIEPGEVEAALRDLDGVHDAVVTVHGERLVAYLAAGAEPDDATIRTSLARQLPDYMVPAILVRLPELPLSANGKVARRALPEPGAPPGAGSVPPRDGTELELVAVWEDVLGRAPVGVTDDFFELGGTSLQVISLLTRIGERYGVDLPVATMFTGAATVEALARRLRTGEGTGSWSTVVPLRTGGTRAPLFCLPPAVGNALSYVDLARRLPEDQPVYGLQAVGLDAGQTPVQDLDTVAARFTAAVREIQPQGPYRLLGYCLGSVFAFAVARRLVEDGQQVAFLGVLDGGPPMLDNGFEQADEADIAAWFAWELGRSADRTLRIDATDLRGLAGDDLVAEVVRRAVAADVLPPGTAGPQLGRLLATFQAGVRAARQHRAEPLPVHILGLVATQEDAPDHPVTRWAPLARAGLDLVHVPGDHYTMMRPPHVETVARTLERALRSGERSQP